MSLGRRAVVTFARGVVGTAEFFERHRNLIPSAFLCLSTLLSISILFNAIFTPSFAISVNGTTMAVVEDRETVDEAIDAAEQEGEDILGYGFLDDTVDYEFNVIRKTEITGQDRIDTYLDSRLEDLNENMRQTAVFINDERIGVVKDEDAVYDVLYGIRDQYVNDSTLSCAYQEDVALEDIYAEGGLLTATELKNLLETGSTASPYREVQQGETLGEIAEAAGLAQEELLALNPGIAADTVLKGGDLLAVRESEPLVHVLTVEHQTRTETIPVPVETKEDSSMYKGTSKIVSEGSEGEKQIEEEVSFTNGVETGRTVMKETVTKEAVPTVKAVGTKPKPTTASTGSFSWPVSGRISSRFGSRYIFGSYSFHKGIDIVCSYGTPVKAADGGVVVSAGWLGTLGNCVVIQHDNGIKTYYGHNSSLTVSAGQRVAKGQTVAHAGSTGRSTGVHCHFGVVVNGNYVNPLNYLK